MTGATDYDSGYNLSSAKLPGGSFVEAIFNRRLMSWSDRGGASMVLGDVWAEHCWEFLQSRIGRDVLAPGGVRYRVHSTVRLDDNPEIEREANRNQLENPDFLLVGRSSSGPGIVVQATDAKFAADRIKTSQVSPQAVKDLITIPDAGATRAVLEPLLRGVDLADIEIVPGMFLSPESPFTDSLLRRARQPPVENDSEGVLVRIPVVPGDLFESVDHTALIPTLARIDRLPVSPRENLLAAVYYLRLACACYYFWNEQTRPLLTGNETSLDEIEPGLVAAEISQRGPSANSAYGMIISWHREVQQVIAARKTIADSMRLPVGMGEIRATVGDADSRQGRARVKQLRGALEQVFRQQLLAEVGTIYPDDYPSVSDIVQRIRGHARDMRPALLEELTRAVGAERSDNHT